ncbi:MAG: putative metal-dependent hydrolase [Lentimonas sp.]|jgi:predicted metal-dependent hydrolase
MPAKIVQIYTFPELGAEWQDVIFQHTKTRSIRISIGGDLKIKVNFPKSCSQKKALEFFESKIIWVRNSLQKMQIRLETRQNIKKNLQKDLNEEEILDKKHYLILRCRQLAETHGFKIGKVAIRQQKSIWGSCSTKNNISLNLSLVFLRDELIDYVILHELAHTKVKNHSPSFWKEVARLMPEFKRLDRELRKYSLR